MWLFHDFNFERNYAVLKSKSPCILLNNNINFNKSKTESKTENHTHSFRETNLVLQLIYESQIRIEMNEGTFRLFCSKETFVFYLNV